MSYRAGIITLSDKGYKGEREDKSGEVIRKQLEKLGSLDNTKLEVEQYNVLPDEKNLIVEKMCYMADEEGLDILVTTGGTGLGPRDFTPEATLEIIDKEVPGLAEAMRFESMKKTPHGMLSRGIAGIRNKTLIINLPGSPKAVEECLEVILPALPHALEVLKGEASECADQRDKS